MIRRVRPAKGDNVVPLRAEALSVEQQQDIARKRARQDLPTVQRDLSEIWGRVKQPRRKGKQVA